MSNKSRAFCFTVNNYTDACQTTFKELECTYMVYGREIGESGTPHLQGYVYFPNPRSISGVKNIHKKAHWEIAKGNHEQNRTYCTKQGDYVETGLIPMSQKRKGECNIERWDLARKAAEEGRFADIPSDIYVKHLSNLKKIRQEVQTQQPIEDGELPHQWIWGAAGSGKTSRAFAENPGAYLKGLNKWWDGYQDQETVIIDDMDPFHKSMARDFKIWADRYPFPAECKGGSLCIRPKKLVVTSNYRINEVWDDETTQKAMNRRFTEIYVPSNEPITDNVYHV